MIRSTLTQPNEKAIAHKLVAERSSPRSIRTTCRWLASVQAKEKDAVAISLNGTGRSGGGLGFFALAGGLGCDVWSSTVVFADALQKSPLRVPVGPALTARRPSLSRLPFRPSRHVDLGISLTHLCGVPIRSQSIRLPPALRITPCTAKSSQGSRSDLIGIR